MFIRNDISGEKKYSMEKLGEIIGLDEDEIRVVLDESEKEITGKKGNLGAEKIFSGYR